MEWLRLGKMLLGKKVMDMKDMGMLVLRQWLWLAPVGNETVLVTQGLVPMNNKAKLEVMQGLVPHGTEIVLEQAQGLEPWDMEPVRVSLDKEIELNAGQMVPLGKVTVARTGTGPWHEEMRRASCAEKASQLKEETSLD